MFVSSGSSGVRGRINDGFDVELGLHIGKLIGNRYKGTVAIASDMRMSGVMLKSAVSAGLMSAGANVVDLGTVPTPALQFYVKSHDNVDGGVMITASHNPEDFNGVKAVSYDGMDDPFLKTEDVESIMRMQVPQVPWKDIGEELPVVGFIDEYIDAVIGLVDARSIRDAGLKVCVECANGAAMTVIPEILRKLDVQMVMINNYAMGELTSQDTELTAANMEDLGHMTVKTGCDFGIAFDADSDRCLFTDAQGKMVSGDASMAVIGKLLLSKRKGDIITSVATSSAVEDALTPLGGVVKYVPVGAPDIVQKVEERDAVMGGEVNGGLVFPQLQYCRDAQMATACMLEAVAKFGPLSEQAGEIPVYSYFNATIDCPDDRKSELVMLFTEKASGTKYDATDGVKVFFEDGWVLTRPSCTGPVFRVYSQSTDPGKAQARLDEYVELAKGFLAQ